LLGSARKPPPVMVIDLDATDSPLHGHQEGRFLHGYYDCHCYLPLFVFWDRHLLAAKLRSADMPARPARRPHADCNDASGGTPSITFRPLSSRSKTTPMRSQRGAVPGRSTAA